MEKKLYELTNPQKNIWLSEQYYSNTNINNIVGYIQFPKVANTKLIEKSFNIFISKNDSFRIKILNEKGHVQQYFDEIIYYNIETELMRNKLDLKNFETSFPHLLLNTNNQLLFNAKILLMPDKSAILALSTHHLISDAWNMSLCLEGIFNIYQQLLKGLNVDSEKSPSYLDFINYQKKYEASNSYSKDKTFWEEYFNELPNTISFKPNIKVSVHADRAVYNFDKELIKRINDYCKNAKISDYVFLLSIFGVYFRKVLNYKKFIIGNPILNRANSAQKKTTGLFVTVLPYIFDVQDDMSFSELCQKTKQGQMSIYRHIHYPYSEILKYIRNKFDYSDNLYDVIFSYQNRGIPNYCKWLPNHSQVESLQIHIKSLNNEVDNSLSIFYDYLTDVFTSEEINLMHNRILKIIEQALDNPQVSVGQLQIINSSEKRLLLKNFNKTRLKYKIHSNIVKEFEKTAKKYPNKMAVSDSFTSLTYKELNNKANILANKLISLNIKTDIVAFSLKRSVDIIVSILGILKAGYTYMPIDTEYPIDRINYMLENSNAKILISTADISDNICYSETIIDYNGLDFSIQNSKSPNAMISSNNIAYMMYTSGSTGLPKAVQIKHKNVLNFVSSVQKVLDYKPHKYHAVVSVTSVCFDIFVFEVFPTLLSGLTLVIANEIEAKSPDLLSKLISKFNVSKIMTTPSRIELLCERNNYIKGLKTIKEFILGGEPLPPNLLSNLQNQTNSKIYNFYGPTETCVYSTFKDVTTASNITIGKPIGNTQIYILNESNEIQPIGVKGEICIGGDGVGAGYFNNDEKNKESFIVTDFSNNQTIYKTGDIGYWQIDGELMCLGRKDHQVKLRGYRIELDDVRKNILTFNGILKCVADVKQDKNGKQYLCAYYVSNREIDELELKKKLVNVLPNYMIPTYYIRLKDLPLNLNHKIDRKALPLPDFDKIKLSKKYVPPTNLIEERICDSFKSILNIEKIGIENDIFEYNVDSLELIKIQTDLLKYNYKLNTQDFYKYRTIKNLAEILNTSSDSEKKENIDSIYLKNINNIFHKHGKLIKFHRQEYKNILLTGATGYLGIHILESLLNSTNSKITCIIREKGNITAQKRLADLYKYYFNKELDNSRIEIISSNITSPYLGLDEEAYKKLAYNIDLIINAVANVRYYGDYNKFKATNVDVVDHLIKLSQVNNTKFYHISTLGVSGNYLVNLEKNYKDFSENNFYIGQNYKENVYIRTKFEAEELIYKNTVTGLNASILRVGNLTGRYNDGKFQKNILDNAFYNFLRLFLVYKIVPTTVIKKQLEFTPVDCCAEAIVKIILYVKDMNYVYHIFNNNYISVNDFIHLLNNLGYTNRTLTGAKFKEELIQISQKNSSENVLKGIVNDLDDKKGIKFSSTVNQKNNYTNSYLEKLGFSWPKIDDEYIEKLIKHMKEKKYI